MRFAEDPFEDGVMLWWPTTGVDQPWFEFESDDGVLPPEWRHFPSKASLDDFVRRDPGREPLTLPEPALDPSTAAKLRRQAEDDVRKAQAELREAKSRFAVDKARLDGLLRDATRSRVRDDDAELKKRRDALLAATAPSDQKSSEELVLRKRVEELTQENARLKAEHTGTGDDQCQLFSTRVEETPSKERPHASKRSGLRHLISARLSTTAHTLA